MYRRPALNCLPQAVWVEGSVDRLVSLRLLVVMRPKLLAWLPGPGWVHSHVANVLRPVGLPREVAGSVAVARLKLQSPVARTGAGLCPPDPFSWTPAGVLRACSQTSPELGPPSFLTGSCFIFTLYTSPHLPPPPSNPFSLHVFSFHLLPPPPLPPPLSAFSFLFSLP